ncbi:hypothetical protein F3K40_32055 [Streptomyces sp. LBUM 1478]|nr:hypothetical protein [Streptomyces sp. LBUM 1478]
MPLSLSQLERHLLGAAEVLRGPLSPHQYQDYLLPFVFLKHASDVPRPTPSLLRKGDSHVHHAPQTSAPRAPKASHGALRRGPNEPHRPCPEHR